jgi:hypothetical protein
MSPFGYEPLEDWASPRTRLAVALVHLAEAGQPGQSAFGKKD